jgi:hypothetical protein
MSRTGAIHEHQRLDLRSPHSSDILVCPLHACAVRPFPYSGDVASWGYLTSDDHHGTLVARVTTPICLTWPPTFDIDVVTALFYQTRYPRGASLMEQTGDYHTRAYLDVTLRRYV